LILSRVPGRADAPPKKSDPAFPTYRVLLKCLLRTYFVGAGFNTRGMQNVGLAYSMEPGLRAIYRDEERLRAACARYVAHYNTHPFWTPLMVGVFLGVEKKISQGLFPIPLMDKVRGTTIYTLSAIGDSLFNGGLLVLWSLSTICLLLAGFNAAAAAWCVFCFIALQAFKAATFLYGIKEDLSFLSRLKRWNLINWGQRLKIVNSGLLVLLWTLVWPGPIIWYLWAAVIGSMAGPAWIVMRLHISREVLGALLLAAYLSYPLVLGLWESVF